jgi:hypothetical protein
VTDWFPPRLEKRDPKETWTVACAPSTEPGVFTAIEKLAVDAHGSLYVMDPRLLQVQKRDPQGSWIVVLDAVNQPGEFHDLVSIAVDRKDNLYVADHEFSRVMMGDSHGSGRYSCLPAPASDRPSGRTTSQWTLPITFTSSTAEATAAFISEIVKDVRPSWISATRNSICFRRWQPHRTGAFLLLIFRIRPSRC